MYKKGHIASDYDLILDIIKEKYPEMYNTAVNVSNKHYMYAANMLICKKELFDKYANWLFDILFETEKRIQQDVLTRDDYQQRVYGFLSERLMNVFISYHSELKVKEVPLLFYEENEKKYKKARRKKFIRNVKHKLLSIFGIGK